MIAGRVFRPVDSSQLIVFRILFGLILSLEGFGSILTGWVRRVFVEPEFTFKIPGFVWLEPPPGAAMYGLYIALGVLGLCVMLGFYFRLTLSSYLVLWTWAYLTQTASYNNHYYLLILICFLLLLTPANTWASFDVRRRPELRRLDCPRWCVTIFIVQIAIVYVYAGMAKIYPDWLEGRPVRLWFSARADTALLGPLFQQDWFVWAVTYGGILFDLLIVPALLWRRTRFAAFLVSIGFHLFNSVTFRIGTFPYLALAFSFFFFAPRIARRLLRRPAFAGATEGQVASSRSPRERVVLVALALYFVVQIALPLRHWLYPGQVYWNEDGHRMSWRMMTRHKQGYVTFRLHDPESGRTWNVRPGDRLSQKQARRIGSRPDMIWQFAQRLAAESRAAGEVVEIRARGMVSLNGRTLQPLVDPEVDLASTRWNLVAPTEWIVPLRNRNPP